MKGFFIFIWETIKIALVASLIVIPIRFLIFQPFFVKGQSMEPNFENGDYLIVDELSYRFNEPQRGDVVVFRYPNDPSQRYIKRIIGLPGETVEIKSGKVEITKGSDVKVLEENNYLPEAFFTSGDLRITLDGTEYFVLGDNRSASSDSRTWGTLPRKDIIGKVALRAWPANSLSAFKTPVYNNI
jgi:signal peptidase I